MHKLYFPILLLSLAFGQAIQAKQDTRLFRYPDVSQSHIVFVYAGDIWITQISGGQATRLTSTKGEESFPKFSPNGKIIAFTANYDGNLDIYTLPLQGGMPQRITHHPDTDRIIDWYPDGDTLLFASTMTSGRARYNQIHKTSYQGGLPQKLPMPYGEMAALSQDAQFIAYTTIYDTFTFGRTWKRYRGGQAPDIWLFNLKDFSSINITDDPAVDSSPMWYQKAIYYLSERGPNRRANLWAYNVDSGKTSQVTNYRKKDIRYPSLGHDRIIYVLGKQLMLFDISNDEHKPIDVHITDDQLMVRPQWIDVSKNISSAGLSPNGVRAVFEARGEIFTVPAKNGPIHNLSNTSGIAERHPSWSPDGKHIAYFSDLSGEYELYIKLANTKGQAIQLTKRNKGFGYRPQWSPNSQKLAFIDHSKSIYIYDIKSKTLSKADQRRWLVDGSSHGMLRDFNVSWSPDSRWLAYTKGMDNRNEAVFVFDSTKKTKHQLTSGYYDDHSPVFGAEGKFLYLLTKRHLEPIFSDIEPTWAYANSTQVAAITLKYHIASPLAAQNDEEKEEPKNADRDKKPDNENIVVNIDFQNFEKRLVTLPIEPGNYSALYTAKEKLFYQRMPRSGSTQKSNSVYVFDLKTKKEQTVIEGIDKFLISANQKKLLIKKQDKYFIIDAEAKQKAETSLATDELSMWLHPKQEWQQMLRDTIRYERDYFYDPNLHGLNWSAMQQRYGELMQAASSQWDAYYVIKELIAELGAGHVGAGFREPKSIAAKRRNVGMLGIDYQLNNGAYQIKSILDAGPRASEISSPLSASHLRIKSGDYILAINRIPLDTEKDPWSALQGLAEKEVILTVNDKPSSSGAREVIVSLLSQQNNRRLRELAWIEGNRQKVLKASDGRIAYIYVPNTALSGQNELMRQYRAQFSLPGLIIDERFNSGGALGDRLVELLNRPAYNYLSVRNGDSFPIPEIGHNGPKAMLINGWSGSGGDGFPYLFRKAGLGPIIGLPTWGGLVGPNQRLPLLDGGAISAPPSRFFSTQGNWEVEGIGVKPDIAIIDDPTLMAKGHDPQLEKAIEVILKELQTKTSHIKPKDPVPPVHKVQ